MQFNLLNSGWDAEPNAPAPKITMQDQNVKLCFFLNYFLYKDASAGDVGCVTFNDCQMYRLGPSNEEGFFRGQFRYSPSEIKWGEFYELMEADWEHTFPTDKIIVTQGLEKKIQLHHYLLFFKDETFECVAGGWKFERLET